MRRSLFLCLCYLAVWLGHRLHAQPGNPGTDSLEAALRGHPARDTVRIRLLLELSLETERDAPGQSVGYALDAQEIARELNLPMYVADALQQAGNSYGILGANLKQRECYASARKIFQDQGNVRGEIATLNNLGTVSLDEKQYDWARQYLFKALQMTLAGSHKRNLPAIFNNLGNLYDGLEKHDSALYYYQQAFERVRSESPDSVVESIILVNIGTSYAELGDMARSLGIYRQAIPYKVATNDLYGLTEVYLNIGDTYMETGPLDSAEHYLLRGLEIADTIEATEMQELVHRQLARLYDTLGRLELALEHSMESAALLDSLRMEESSTVSEATQLRIEAEEAIHQRELAAIEQQEKLQQQRILMVAGVVVLALILLLLFFINRRYQERRKAAASLESKVKERTEELSRSNSQLQRALADVEATTRDLNTFIYRSSHDLRGPLTSISGLLDILRQHLREEEALRYVGLVEDKTEHLGQLLGKLMESVEILAREPQPTTFAWDGLWEDVRQDIKKKPGRAEVELGLEAPAGLQIPTDRACLRLILNNLLHNAIDFRRRDGQAAWCKVRVRATGHELHVSIADNGIGMDEAIQQRAFEMFYRGSLQAQGIGNGMGLYTARKMAQLLGGTLTLESKAGEGSEFTLTLPLSQK